MNNFENNLEVENYRQSMSESQAFNAGVISDSLVAKAVDFIKRNAGRQMQVRDVVDYVAVSRREIEKRFKKSLNLSILHEIKRTRVQLIAKMLLQTSDSVSEIASKLCFTDVAHFARYFKDVEGISPLEYRKKYLCTV
ncbi:MAG: AraC family transcriptional regulator [Phycisphaerales bacterium]